MKSTQFHRFFWCHEPHSPISSLYFLYRPDKRVIKWKRNFFNTFYQLMNMLLHTHIRSRQSWYVDVAKWLLLWFHATTHRSQKLWYLHVYRTLFKDLGSPSQTLPSHVQNGEVTFTCGVYASTFAKVVESQEGLGAKWSSPRRQDSNDMTINWYTFDDAMVNVYICLVWYFGSVSTLVVRFVVTLWKDVHN